jgi:hypothetical protein
MIFVNYPFTSLLSLVSLLSLFLSLEHELVSDGGGVCVHVFSVVSVVL